MYTTIRLKQKVTSEKMTITFPEITKLIGREVEIQIMVEGEINDPSVPPIGIQNSSHVAGSIILDQEAMQQLLSSRFR